jgi:starch synthase
MKVAFLAYDFGEYCIRLASGLAHATVGEPEVLLLLPEQLAEPHLSKLDPAVRYMPFHKPRLRQPAVQVRTAWRLVREIRRFDPDVIHIQEGHMWFNLALPLLRGYPLVVTIHDVQHHVGDEDSQKRPQRIMDIAYRRADEVIVHAPQLKEMVVQRLGIDPNVIHVIPHVVLGDQAAGAQTAEGRAGNGTAGSHPGQQTGETAGAQLPAEPQILFFGRIWPYKGLEYLIKAEPAITAALPGAKIVIAGEGEDFARYRQMMTNPEHYRVLNSYISDETRAELFAQASVVVLPYIDASQSGVIPIAYSFGKPVVATTVGGLPAMVDDGVTGYLVPPCDERALAEAVIRVLQEPGQAERMGEKGRRKINTECAADVLGQQLLAVYAKAIEKKG